MTAPVQEPTPGREVSGLGYGARQLFRRPAPVAAPVYTDMTIAGRRFHAPHVMAGVPPMAFSGNATVPWVTLPRGYAIWPGGLVVQALQPYVEAGASRTTETTDVHLAAAITKETQNAANKAAASVSFEFTPEEAGLDVSGATEYEAIFVFKNSGTTNTMHIDFSSPTYLNTNWNHTILNTSDYYGNDYYGTYGMSLQEYSPAVGDTIQIKVWFEGSGSTAFCAAIYWMPIADQSFWNLADGTANGWSTTLPDNETFLSATSSNDATEANYASRALADTQLRDGPFDAAYVVSIAGSWDFVSTYNYWDGTNTQARYSLAPTHEYIEARINASSADDGSVEGFVTLYDNGRICDQAYVAQRSWGLCYMGLHPRWEGINTQYAMWRPDPAGNYFPNANGLGTDVRVGARWRYLDFLTPQFDNTGARIAFEQLASGAPWIQ